MTENKYINLLPKTVKYLFSEKEKLKIELQPYF